MIKMSFKQRSLQQFYIWFVVFLLTFNAISKAYKSINSSKEVSWISSNKIDYRKTFPTR